MDEFVQRCDVIVSVCPPGSALDVATDVAERGFDGVYADVNAIAPATSRKISTLFDRFVDGGVVGPPARTPGTTRLYLCGEHAPTIAPLWDGSVVDARTIEGEAGAASALKMCYAAWTKITSALLLDVCALAKAEGVDRALADEWSISLAHLSQQATNAARTAAPKAWRFEDEMREIASTFNAVGLPGGFANGAAAVFARLAPFKDATEPTLDDVIAALRRDV
jgi:3-hydroxyisobutyrate dehydrogenase-like beta-hydroxyacid dehydrogenase